MEDDEDLYYLDSDFENDIESDLAPLGSLPQHEIKQVVDSATSLTKDPIDIDHKSHFLNESQSNQKTIEHGNDSSLDEIMTPTESVKDIQEENVIDRSSTSSNQGNQVSKTLFQNTASDPELILDEEIESIPSIQEINSLPVDTEHHEKNIHLEDQFISKTKIDDVEKLSPLTATAKIGVTNEGSQDGDDSLYVVKQQLQLLKKSSFRKQSSIKNGGSKSNSFSTKSEENADFVNLDVDENSVEIPEEDIPIVPHVDHEPKHNIELSHSSKMQKSAVITMKFENRSQQRQISPHDTPRTMKMGDNNPINQTPIRRRPNQPQQQYHNHPNRTRDHSISSRSNREYTSEEDIEDNKSVPEDLNYDQYPSPSNANDNTKVSPGVNRSPFYASGHEHAKPPVPRQDPNKVKAYRIKRMKMEKKVNKKKKNFAWGKDPKYHYDEKTGLFTTYEIDARIEARKEETKARRQAYHYNPMAHLDEISDDEGDDYGNSNRRKKQDTEESKWKKKLIRKENPIVLDREAAEREELRRRMEYISMQSYLNQQNGIKNSYQIFAVPKDFKGFSPPRTHKPGPPPRPPPPASQLNQQDHDLMGVDTTQIQPKPPAFPPQSNSFNHSHNHPGTKNNAPPAGNIPSTRPFRNGRRIVDPAKATANKGVENENEYQLPKDGFAIYERENPNNPLVVRKKIREEAQMRVQRMREYYRTVQRTLQQREREKQQFRQKKEYHVSNREQLELQKEEEELLREHNVRLSFRTEDKDSEREVTKEAFPTEKSIVKARSPQIKLTSAVAVNKAEVDNPPINCIQTESATLAHGYNEEPSIMSHTIPSVASNDSEDIVPAFHPVVTAEPTVTANASDKLIVHDSNEDSENDYEVDWDDEDNNSTINDKVTDKNESNDSKLTSTLNKEQSYSQDTLPAETVTTAMSIEPLTVTETAVDIISSTVTETDAVIVKAESNEMDDQQEKVKEEDDDDYGDDFDDITEENVIQPSVTILHDRQQTDKTIEEGIDDKQDASDVDMSNNDAMAKSSSFRQPLGEVEKIHGEVKEEQSKLLSFEEKNDIDLILDHNEVEASDDVINSDRMMQLDNKKDIKDDEEENESYGYSHDDFEDELYSNLDAKTTTVIPIPPEHELKEATSKDEPQVNTSQKQVDKEADPIKIKGFYEEDETLTNDLEKEKMRILHDLRLRESMIYHEEHPEEFVKNSDDEYTGEEEARIRQWDLDRVFEEIRKNHPDDAPTEKPGDLLDDVTNTSLQEIEKEHSDPEIIAREDYHVDHAAETDALDSNLSTPFLSEQQSNTNEEVGAEELIHNDVVDEAVYPEIPSQMKSSDANDNKEEEDDAYDEEGFESEPETDIDPAAIQASKSSSSQPQQPAETSRNTSAKATMVLQPHPPTTERISSATSRNTVAHYSNNHSGNDNTNSALNTGNWPQRKLRPLSQPRQESEQFSSDPSVSADSDINIKTETNLSPIIDRKSSPIESTPDPAKLKIIKRNSLLRASSGSVKSANSEIAKERVISASPTAVSGKSHDVHSSTKVKTEEKRQIADLEDDSGLFDVDIDDENDHKLPSATAQLPDKPLPKSTIKPIVTEDPGPALSEPISSVVMRLLNQFDEEDLDNDDIYDDELFN